MRSHVARIVLGSCLVLFASTAFADDKPGASAPSDAPVAAPSAPEITPSPSNPSTASSTPANAASANASANTPAANAHASSSAAPDLPDPLANLPKTCAPIAKRMATPNREQAMSVRISLASCIGDANLKPLQLLDTSESMLEVEAAIAPAFLLLDDVIARGDARNRLLAHHAKMLVVQQASTRMLASVPAAAQPTVEAAALRDSRRALVEVMIAPWFLQIADEARAANTIAKAHPKLQNGSVALALRDTRKVAPDPIAVR